MIDAVIERLKTNATGLSGRVAGAADFADLMRRNALPQVTPAAHVLPLGLQGESAEAGAGSFVQSYRESVGVILTIRSHTKTGAGALADVNLLIFEIIKALAGWAPGDESGVFILSRGSLINMSAGTLVYQLDFTISDQLRILT